MKNSSHRMLVRSLALYGTCGLAAASAAAAETQGSAQLLQPVVVTASGKGQDEATAPASVSVISGEELQAKPVHDLVDALGEIEGVTVSGNANRRTLQLRGLDRAYVLMLIDGRRVDSTSAVFRGNDFDTGWIPVEAIDRVEVIRGPMSSLYGSDAIGGVINIITKPVSEQWHGSVTVDTVVQEDSAAGDSRKLGFYVSGPLAEKSLGVKLYGSVDRREADGAVNPDPESGGESLDGFARNDNHALNGELTWAASNTQNISLALESSSREHDEQDLDRLGVALTHKGKWSFGDTEIKLYGDRIENNTGNIGGQSNPNKAHNASIDGRVTLPIDAWAQTLTLGAEARYQKLKDPSTLTGRPGTDSFGESDSTDVRQQALFIEDEFMLRDDLLLTLGNRLDHHENFGNHNSPRAYLVYLLSDEISVKGGWGKAFRAPTLLQNSPNWGSASCGSATAGCYIVGSDELKPETSESKEIGVRFDYSEWGGGLTVFRNDIEDMIDISSRTRDPDLAPTFDNFVGFLPDGRPIFAYQNVSKVKTEGVEASFRYNLTTDLDMRASYTYLDAKDVSDGQDPKPLLYRPRHSGTVKLGWSVSDQWDLGLTGNYVGEQYAYISRDGSELIKLQEYVTFDLQSLYAINEYFSVGAGVLNLADKQVDREQSYEINEDGRRYYLSLKAQF
ncbi:TonB-dependent receptor [Hahella sp. KA22]|uniref:TonB-dependent receptor domain-containing protein n=1 Tax=Hahella sp. KA22 TaxID=1628392 RepID=UPI000FDE2A28|nr:TonB-dependent receptor [Hahella sp. KA22]AZZ94963.1 TonB-dependent receptor [Hahella sp. KA22]QAY52608.1 TonB-dependent receptor [Hahella sp. KA22]